MRRRFIVLALGSGVLLACATDVTRADMIKIGIGPVTAAGPIFIAEDRGYFKAEGLEPQVTSFDAAQTTVQGVVAGDLDVGATAASAAAYNLGAKGALKIIGGQSREVPGFNGSAFLASDHGWDTGLRSLKDLGNRTVGIVQAGGPIHYEVQLAADKYKVDMATLRLVALQSLPNMATALAGNQVDAGIEVNTLALKLSGENKAHILGWVGDEIPWQNALLFAGSKTVDQKRPLIEAFLRAFKRGARDYHDAFTGPDGKRRDGPTANEVLTIIAVHLNQPAAQLALGISYVDPTAAIDVQDVMHQIAWFKSQKMIPADADGEAMIDRRYVVPLLSN